MIKITNRVAALAFAGTLLTSAALCSTAVAFAEGNAASADASKAEATVVVKADGTEEHHQADLALAAQIAADPEGTHSVVDGFGNELEIPNTVDSIVVPFPAATQMVLGLGGADLLSGCYILTTDMNDAMFGDYMDKVTLIKPSEINIEVVMNCDPDFAVVASQGQKDTIAEANVPTILFNGSSFDNMSNTVHTIAEAIGTEEALEKADAYRAFYDDLVETVGDMTKDVADEDRPRVFICTEDDGLSTAQIGGIVSDWIYLSGGISICDVLGVTDNEPTLTAEQILEADPDIIICTTVAGRDAILGNSAFDNVKAVKNGKVYMNPLGGSVWFKAHFEAPLQLAWAPTIISPELCAELDTRAYVDEFYQTFYGYTVTDEDYETIMNPSVGSR